MDEVSRIIACSPATPDASRALRDGAGLAHERGGHEPTVHRIAAMGRHRTEPELRHRRTGILVALVALSALVAVEPLYRPVSAALVACHAAWTVALLGAALTLLPYRRLAGGILAGVSVACSALFALGLAVSGGVHSPDFMYWPLVPVALMAVMQDEVVATAAGSLTAVAAIVIQYAIEGTPMAAAADLFLTVVFTSSIAAFGSWSFRRLRELELTQEREKNEALRSLAKSEERRARSERLALVGELSAGVVHEISNPLVYMLACIDSLRTADGLRADSMPPGELTETLEDLNDGVHRISAIVADLKSVARTSGGQAEPCALFKLVSDALRIGSVRLGKSVQVVREMAEPLPAVRVDPGRLSQVLLNLLINAADALQAAAVAHPRIVVRCEASHDRVRLSVEDNGPGVADGLALFEPFVSTKPQGKGMGLGLALSREYVRAFSGELRHERPAEGGARFVIELPVAELPVRPDGAPAEGAGSRGLGAG